MVADLGILGVSSKVESCGLGICSLCISTPVIGTRVPPEVTAYISSGTAGFIFLAPATDASKPAIDTTAKFRSLMRKLLQRTFRVARRGCDVFLSCCLWQLL